MSEVHSASVRAGCAPLASRDTIVIRRGSRRRSRPATMEPTVNGFEGALDEVLRSAVDDRDGLAGAVAMVTSRDQTLYSGSVGVRSAESRIGRRVTRRRSGRACGRLRWCRRRGLVARSGARARPGTGCTHCSLVGRAAATHDGTSRQKNAIIRGWRVVSDRWRRCGLWIRHSSS